MFDKGLISKIYRELTQYNVKKTIQFKKKKTGRLDKEFFKKEHSWPDKHTKKFLVSLVIKEMQIQLQKDITLFLRMAAVKKTKNKQCC